VESQDPISTSEWQKKQGFVFPAAQVLKLDLFILSFRSALFCYNTSLQLTVSMSAHYTTVDQKRIFCGWHQYVEILVGDNNFIGMPFVLRSGGNWYKNNGSDYYVPFQFPQKKKTAGDGKGTASAFLEEIANQESEAERSLMHRYVTSQALVSYLVWQNGLSSWVHLTLEDSSLQTVN
jgi:hypothetical protein